MSRYLCCALGWCSFPVSLLAQGFVIVFAPQAQGFRQVRGVASRAGHRNEAHLDLIIITDLFLSLAGTLRRRQIIPCHSPMPRHPIATGPQHSPVPLPLRLPAPVFAGLAGYIFWKYFHNKHWIVRTASVSASRVQTNITEKRNRIICANMDPAESEKVRQALTSQGTRIGQHNAALQEFSEALRGLSASMSELGFVPRSPP